MFLKSLLHRATFCSRPRAPWPVYYYPYGPISLPSERKFALQPSDFDLLQPKEGWILPERIRRQQCSPYFYGSWEQKWIPVMRDHNGRPLKPGEALKVVSWNINFFCPGPSARASAALEHLYSLFRASSRSLVIMLQEVGEEARRAIQENY